MTDIAEYLAIEDYELDDTLFNESGRPDPVVFLIIQHPEWIGGRVHFGYTLIRESGAEEISEWCTNRDGEGLFHPTHQFVQLAGTCQFSMGTGRHGRDTLTRALLSNIRGTDEYGYNLSSYRATYDRARRGYAITRK